MRANKNKIVYHFIFIASILGALILAGNKAIGYSEYPIIEAVSSAPPVAKGSCPHPDRKPSNSDTKGKHMDEDCCPDPDEWPNPGCAYSAHDYGVMMSGPK